MLFISKLVIVIFGFFILVSGIIMFVKPALAREILRKAGSTNLINYSEITFRLICSLALINFSSHSEYPEIMSVFGWFMVITALILYAVPRKIHHEFSLKCAAFLKPVYFRIIAPFAILFGCIVVFSVLKFC